MQYRLQRLGRRAGDQWSSRSPTRQEPATAAIFNLNHPAHSVHWHFFSMSVSNVVVIVAMLIVFALAVLLPFPGRGARQP